MRIREEHDAEPGSAPFNDILRKYIKQYNQIFWTPSMAEAGSVYPTLKQAQGRIVIFGIESPDIGYAWGGDNFSIQDEYAMKSLGEVTDKKIPAVNDQLAKAASGPASTMYFNFLSGELLLWG